MKISYACVVLALSTAGAAADEKTKEKPLKPCTIRSPSSGAFFDLNSLYIQPPSKDSKSSKKDDKPESWHARGYDYGANFTLNFCGPVVEELEDVKGVSKSHWSDVSAFYTVGESTYSIGQQNSELVFRGRKLVLNYTGGSPCDSEGGKRSLLNHEAEDIKTSKLVDDDDDDDDLDRESKRPSNPTIRRKSTIISLLCEKEPMAPKAPPAAVAFVGASQDDCTYFFEVRSPAACAGAETDSSGGALGPGGVFGVIMLIALLVYLVGGCVYQRTVMHQRGWRQLPNYSMWAGICGCFLDVFIILTSSCTRFLPRRRGYSRLSINANGRPPRGSSADDENRLIDNLDEEWDD